MRPVYEQDESAMGDILSQKLSTRKVDNIQHSKRQSSAVDDAYKLLRTSDRTSILSEISMTKKILLIEQYSLQQVSFSNTVRVLMPESTMLGITTQIAT